MLHIKSHNESVVGVDLRTGVAIPLGRLEFVEGDYIPNISTTATTNLSFANFRDSLNTRTITTRYSVDGQETSRETLIMTSFNGANSDVYLNANETYGMRVFYNLIRLNLLRNNNEHDRQHHTLSVRVAYRLSSSYMQNNEETSLTATLRSATANFAGDVNISKKFVERGLINRGWDYIAFFNSSGNQIDRFAIEGNDDSTWVDFSGGTLTKDNIRYTVHDVYIKRVGTNDLRKILISFSSLGSFTFTLDDKTAEIYRNLPEGKMLRIRFIYMRSKPALLGTADEILPNFTDGMRLARPSRLEQATLSEDGQRMTFKLNRPCYLSIFLNDVQVAERLETTNNGELTFNFNTNLNLGSEIKVRAATSDQNGGTTTFTVNVADTIPPPPVTANLFTYNRIFGNGGDPDELAVAMRDGVVIGTAVISASREFIITLNEGVSLTTGDVVSVHAEDKVGNKSVAEIYEVEVASTTDGRFDPTLGNDTIGVYMDINNIG